MNCLPRMVRIPRDDRDRAFSLVELVMVVVIIAIIAAIAVPRVSSAGRNAQAESIRATVSIVSAAIDHYYAEHSRFPGYNPADGKPDGDWFVKQLTTYTDANGRAQANPGGGFIYGPYLGSPFPTNPYNGLNNVRVKAGRTGAVELNACGWIAVLADGTFNINTDANTVRNVEFTEDEVRAIETLRSGS